MQRDLDTNIYLTNGTVMTNGGTATPLTVGAAIVDALVAVFPQEAPQPSAEQKDARFSLGIRISAGGSQDLTLDDLKTIKHCCDLMYGTLIYGQISAWADERAVPFASKVVS
jgi:hypothetical protein